jgi:uncharacterized protein YbaR (Trm112 family)
MPKAPPVPQWLLDILVCPSDQTPVEPQPDAATATELVCPACSRRYRIDDGIPVMLVEEAVVTDPLTA